MFNNVYYRLWMVGSWVKSSSASPNKSNRLLQFLDIALQGGDARLQGRDRGAEFPQLDEGLPATPSDAKPCHGGSCSRFLKAHWRCGAGEVVYQVSPENEWSVARFSLKKNWGSLYISILSAILCMISQARIDGFKQQRCWFHQGENSDLMQLRRPIKDGKALLNRSNIRFIASKIQTLTGKTYPCPWNRFQRDGYLVLY